MYIEPGDVYTNHAVIDGRYYDLIDGNVSNASKEEEGEYVKSRFSWSMELVFPDTPRNFEPAQMKAHDMSVRLEGVHYRGRGVVRYIDKKYTFDNDNPGVLVGMRALTVFAGIGPLVIE